MPEPRIGRSAPRHWLSHEEMRAIVKQAMDRGREQGARAERDAAREDADRLAEALRVLRKAAFAAGKHIVVTTDYPQGVEAFNRLCAAIDEADPVLAAYREFGG